MSAPGEPVRRGHDPLSWGGLPALWRGRAAGWLRRSGAALAAALLAAGADLVLWAPVLLSFGIGGYFLLPAEPGAVLLTLLAGLAMLGGWVVFASARAGQAGVLLALGRFPAACLAFCALGLLLGFVRAHLVAAPVLSWRYYGPVEGRIVEIDRSARDRIRLTLDQVVLSGVAPGRSPEKVRIALHADADTGERVGATDGASPAAAPPDPPAPADPAPEPGQRVMLSAHLQPPSSPAEPGGWDFRRSAWFSGLGAVGYSRTPVLVVAPAERMDLALAAHRARMALSRAVQSHIPGQSGAIAAALMTGDRSAISEATNAVMRASNLYHIISISGLHMGMLAGFVFAALRIGFAATGRLALIWPTKKISAVVALVAASLYLWLAGPEVATQRAYLTVAVMLLAVLVDRRALSLRTVALAALLLLVLRPESLLEPGFQMSFAATVGLVLGHGWWLGWSRRVPWLLRPLLALLFTSVIAALATGPIAAAHFNRASGYGLIANLLVVPVMGIVVMPAGVGAALLAPFGLAAPALWLVGLGCHWMILVAHWVAGLGGAEIMLPRPPAVVLPLMAACAAVAVLVRGRLRAVAWALALLSLLPWAGVTRPALLVSPAAEAVGLLLPSGQRALSKPGAAFITESWLAADGDGATAQEAAARPAFTGPPGMRVAQWQGRRLVHLTGKGAIPALQTECRDGALVILAAVAPPPKPAASGPESCDLWDLDRLRHSGALAFAQSGALRESAQVAGRRLWTPAPRRP